MSEEIKKCKVVKDAIVTHEVLEYGDENFMIESRIIITLEDGRELNTVVAYNVDSTEVTKRPVS